uniref:Serine/threonine-protein kinase ULK2 n=1 Tax=Talaromyces marneffei PM1 TaxID=1077442 RepID=A0A093UQI3_TALMA
MVYTRLQYLQEPNPRLHVLERSSSFTQGAQWQAIERIDSWPEFADLKRKFLDRLGKSIEPDSIRTVVEKSGFNSIYDESGLAQLHGTTIVMPVAKALPEDTCIRPGGEISVDQPDLRPDWGATMKTASGGRRPIVCGDTKLGWNVLAAVRIVGSNRHGYDEVEGRHLVLPLEQLQHYCLGFDVPFGFILTEEYIVCCHFILSPESKRSPRPKRTQGRYHQHARIQSTSTASSGFESSFSDMSFEPALTDRHVGRVKLSIDPWSPSADDGSFEMKLSLWLLVMEARNHNGLRTVDDDPSDFGPSQEASESKGKERRRETGRNIR